MKTIIALISKLFEPENSTLKSSVNYLLKSHKSNNVWPQFPKLPRFWRAKLFNPKSEILMWDWSSHKLSNFLVPTEKIFHFLFLPARFFKFFGNNSTVWKKTRVVTKHFNEINIFFLNELKVWRFAHFAKSSRTQSKLPNGSFYKSYVSTHADTLMSEYMFDNHISKFNVVFYVKVCHSTSTNWIVMLFVQFD